MRIFKLDHCFDHPTTKGESMKKHYGLMLFFVALVSIGWTVSSQAMELVPVTSFDSTWKTYTQGSGTGTATPNGAKVNLTLQGSGTNFNFYKTGTKGVIGMLATLRVDQVTCDANGFCGIGINQYIGMTGNSRIQLSITLSHNGNGNNVINFFIKTIDLTTNANVVLAQGNIGDYSGAWANGDSKTVGFVRDGSEFWFYVAEHPALIKVQVLDEITPYSDSPTVFAQVGPGTGNSISGSASDIYLIY
jgi:hypothetical protein